MTFPGPDERSGCGGALDTLSMRRREVCGALCVLWHAAAQRRVDEVRARGARQALLSSSGELVNTNTQLFRQAQVALYAGDSLGGTPHSLIDDDVAGVIGRQRQPAMQHGNGERVDGHARRARELLELDDAGGVQSDRRLQWPTGAIKRRVRTRAHLRLWPGASRRSGGWTRPGGHSPRSWPLGGRKRRWRCRLEDSVLPCLLHIQGALDPDRAERQPTGHHAARRTGASAPMSSVVNSRIALAPA
jgi:hypothetical protein